MPVVGSAAGARGIAHERAHAQKTIQCACSKVTEVGAVRAEYKALHVYYNYSTVEVSKFVKMRSRNSRLIYSTLVYSLVLCILPGSECVTWQECVDLPLGKFIKCHCIAL